MTPLVVSFGGGVDSTAMLIEMKNRGIRPDVILFADTGAERPGTYIHIEIMKAWTRRVGFPEIQTVRKVPPIAPYKNLEGELQKNQGLPALAFGWHSCSVKWKVGPQNVRLKELGIGPRRHAIGLDDSPADRKRAGKFAEKAFKAPGVSFWYPLQEWGIDRQRCEAIIEAEGLRVPMKSCCFFCPGMKRVEIQEQARENPGLHQRALDIEANFRAGRHFRPDGVQGLGRKWAWKDVEVTLGKASDAGVASSSLPSSGPPF